MSDNNQLPQGLQSSHGLTASSWPSSLSPLSPSRYMQAQNNNSRGGTTNQAGSGLGVSAPGIDVENELRSEIQARHRAYRAYLDNHTTRSHIAIPTSSNSSSARGPTTLLPTSTSSNVQGSNRRPSRRYETAYSALGLREDVQNPDYQSPPGTMFGNGWNGYHTAEAMRRQPVGPNPILSIPASHPAPEQRSGIPNPILSPDRPGFPTAQESYLAPYFPPPPLLANPELPQFMHPASQAVQSSNSASAMRGSAGWVPPGTLPPSTPSMIRRLQNYTPLAETADLSTPAGRERHRQSHDPSTRASRRNLRESAGHISAASRAGQLPGLEHNNPRLHLAGPASAHVRQLLAEGGFYNYANPFAEFLDHGHMENGNGSGSDTETLVTFDTQERPPPMEAAAMMVDMACTICHEHMVDTVVMPCMHAVMCTWCAELQVPGKKGNRTVPKDRSAKCPVCRSRVKQKVRLAGLQSYRPLLT